MPKIEINQLVTKVSSSIKARDLSSKGEFPVYGAQGIAGYSGSFQTAVSSIAIIKDGAGVGRVQIIPPNSSVIGTLQLLVPKNDVDVSYLFYLFSSMDLGKSFSGATIPHIYFKDYGKNYVNDNSFTLQKEIGVTLDLISSAIESTKQYICSLNELIKSRFNEMFSQTYKTKKWSEVVKIINGKDYKKIPNIKGTYPIYGSGGYMQMRCDEYLTKENSVIIGRKGNVTNPLFIKEKCWNVDTAFGIEPGLELDPLYFYYFSLTINLEDMVTGATIPSLTKTQLLNLMINIPPIELQNEFASFVKQVDKLKFVWLLNVFIKEVKTMKLISTINCYTKQSTKL